MNCPKCGSPLLPDAAFCINCGAPVTPAEDTPLEGNTTPELTLTPSGDPLFGEQRPAEPDAEDFSTPIGESVGASATNETAATAEKTDASATDAANVSDTAESSTEDAPLKGNTTPELTLTPSGAFLFGEQKPAEPAAEEQADAESDTEIADESVDNSADAPVEDKQTPADDVAVASVAAVAAAGDSAPAEDAAPTEESNTAPAEEDTVSPEETAPTEETSTPAEAVETPVDTSDDADEESTEIADDAAPAPAEDSTEFPDEASEDATEVAGFAPDFSTSATDGETTSAPVADETNRFCMGCGAALMPGVAFCTECGMPVGGVPTPVVPPVVPPVGGFGGSTPPPTKRKLSVPVIIAVILVALLLVGLIIGLVIFAGRGDDHTSSSSVAAASSSSETSPAATPAATAASTAAPAVTPAPTASTVTPDNAPHLSTLTITYISKAALDDSIPDNDTPSSFTYYFDSTNRLIRVIGMGQDEFGQSTQVADCSVSYASDGTVLPESTCIPRYNGGVLESAYFTVSGVSGTTSCVTRFAPDGSVVGFSHCQSWYCITDLNGPWAITVPYTRGADGKIEAETTVADARDGQFQFTISATYGDSPTPAAPGSSKLNLNNISYSISPMLYTTTANHGLIIRQGPGTDTARLGTIPYGSNIFVIATNTATSEWVLMTWYSQSMGTTETGWVNTQYITSSSNN